MLTTQNLNNAMHAELKPHGFQRKGSTWYMSSETVIAVLNLQRSQYNATYFLNLGFWLQQIEHIDYPREYQCHVRTRASSLWPEGSHRPEAGAPRIADLLRIEEYRCDAEQRLKQVRQFVAEKLVPTLHAGLTVEGLKQLVADHEELAITRVARNALGLPASD